MSSASVPELSCSGGVLRIFRQSMKELCQQTDIDLRREKRQGTCSSVKRLEKSEDLRHETSQVCKSDTREITVISENCESNARLYVEKRTESETEIRTDSINVGKQCESKIGNKIFESKNESKTYNNIGPNTEVRPKPKIRTKPKEGKRSIQSEIGHRPEAKENSGAELKVEKDIQSKPEQTERGNNCKGGNNCKVERTDDNNKTMRKNSGSRPIGRGERRAWATDVHRDKLPECQLEKKNVNFNRNADHKGAVRCQNEKHREDWSSEFVDIEMENTLEKESSRESGTATVTTSKYGMLETGTGSENMQSRNKENIETLATETKVETESNILHNKGEIPLKNINTPRLFKGNSEKGFIRVQQHEERSAHEDWTNELDNMFEDCVKTNCVETNVNICNVDDVKTDLEKDTEAIEIAMIINEETSKITGPLQSTPKKDRHKSTNISNCENIQECLDFKDFKLDLTSKHVFINNTDTSSSVIETEDKDCEITSRVTNSEVEQSGADAVRIEESGENIDLKDDSIIYVGNVTEERENLVPDLKRVANKQIQENLGNLFKNVVDSRHISHRNNTSGKAFSVEKSSCGKGGSKAPAECNKVKVVDQLGIVSDNQNQTRKLAGNKKSAKFEFMQVQGKESNGRHAKSSEKVDDESLKTVKQMDGKDKTVNEELAEKEVRISSDSKSCYIKANVVSCEKSLPLKPSKGRGTYNRNRFDNPPRFQKKFAEERERKSNFVHTSVYNNKSPYKDRENLTHPRRSSESEQPANFNNKSHHQVDDFPYRGSFSSEFRHRDSISTSASQKSRELGQKCPPYSRPVTSRDLAPAERDLCPNEHLKQGNKLNEVEKLNSNLSKHAGRISPLMSRNISTPEKYTHLAHPPVSFHRTGRQKVLNYKEEKDGWCVPTSEDWVLEIVDTELENYQMKNDKNDNGETKVTLKRATEILTEKELSKCTISDKNVPYLPPPPPVEDTAEVTYSEKVGPGKPKVPYLPPQPDRTDKYNDSETDMDIINRWTSEMEVVQIEDVCNTEAKTKHIGNELDIEHLDKQDNMKVKLVPKYEAGSYRPPPPDEASFEIMPESSMEFDRLLSENENSTHLKLDVLDDKQEHVFKGSEATVKSSIESCQLKVKNDLPLDNINQSHISGNLNPSSVEIENRLLNRNKELLTVVEASESDYAGSTTDASNSVRQFLGTSGKKSVEKLHRGSLTARCQQDDFGLFETQSDDNMGSGTSQAEFSDLPIDDSAAVDIGESDSTSTDYGYIPPVAIANLDKQKSKPGDTSRNSADWFTNQNSYARYWYEQQQQASLRMHQETSPWFPYSYYDSEAYRQWYYQTRNSEQIKNHWEMYNHQHRNWQKSRNGNQVYQNMALRDGIQEKDASNDMKKRSTPDGINDHMTESRLSEYWTERMPYWVISQSPEAESESEVLADCCAPPESLAGPRSKPVISDRDKNLTRAVTVDSVHEIKLKSVDISHSTEEVVSDYSNAQRCSSSKKHITESNNNQNDKTETVGEDCKSPTDIELGKPADSSTPCCCRGEHVQYLVWRMCRCPSGIQPRLHQILPGTQLERSLDLGYQSYDSIEHDESALLARYPATMSHKPEFCSTPAVPGREVTKEGDTSVRLDMKDYIGLHHTGIRPPPGFTPVYTLTGQTSGASLPRRSMDESGMPAGSQCRDNATSPQDTQVNPHTLIEAKHSSCSGMVSNNTSLSGMVSNKTSLSGMVSNNTSLSGMVSNNTSLSGMVSNNNGVHVHDTREVKQSRENQGRGNCVGNVETNAEEHRSVNMQGAELPEGEKRRNRSYLSIVNAAGSGDINNNRSSIGNGNVKHVKEYDAYKENGIKSENRKDRLNSLNSPSKLEPQTLQMRVNAIQNQGMKQNINYAGLPKCLGKSALHLAEVSAGLDRAEITQTSLTSALHIISRAISAIETKLHENPDVVNAGVEDSVVGTVTDEGEVDIDTAMGKLNEDNTTYNLSKNCKKDTNEIVDYSRNSNPFGTKATAKTLVGRQNDSSKEQKVINKSQVLGDSKDKIFKTDPLDKKMKPDIDKKALDESISSNYVASADYYSDTSGDDGIKEHAGSQSPDDLEDGEIPENEFLDIDGAENHYMKEYREGERMQGNSRFLPRRPYMPPRFGPFYRPRSPVSSRSSGASPTRLQKAIEESRSCRHPRIPSPYMYGPMNPYLQPWFMTHPPPPSSYRGQDQESKVYYEAPQLPSLFHNMYMPPLPQNVPEKKKEVSARKSVSEKMKQALEMQSSLAAKAAASGSVGKLKLVEYGSSDDSSDASDIKPFVTDKLDVFKSKPMMCSRATNPVAQSSVEHAKKKFKADTDDESSNVDLEETKNNSDCCGVSFKIASRPPRKLLQKTLKSFKASEWQPPKSETTPQKMKQHTNETPQKCKPTKKSLSEIVTESLKGTSHMPMKETDDENEKEEDESNVEMQHLSQEFPPLYQPVGQKLPPLPPLPPFPASPFWGMYLTNSNSALNGSNSDEQFYGAVSTTTASKKTRNTSTSSPYRKYGGNSFWSPGNPISGFSPSETDSESYSTRNEWRRNFRQFHSFGVKYIDTHCHLDFLFSRDGFRGNLKSYMDKYPETFPDTFEGCVAVFCNPSTFNPYGGLWMEVAKETNVWIAMGCHPKMAVDFTEAAEAGLRKCLRHNKCVALGEIGLDYSGTFWQHKEVQKRVLLTQLAMAIEMEKPLVIHCRDAEEDCLSILKEVVPKNHKIHCHCFTGYYANAKLWLDAFPNMYIGVTPLVTFRTATPTHDLARNIPLNRLLLETDAPYFIPRCIPRDDMQLSNPGLAVTVAKEIAQYQELPVAAVLRQARLNTKFMYGI